MGSASHTPRIPAHICLWGAAQSAEAKRRAQRERERLGIPPSPTYADEPESYLAYDSRRERSTYSGGRGTSGEGGGHGGGSGSASGAVPQSPGSAQAAKAARMERMRREEALLAGTPMEPAAAEAAKQEPEAAESVAAEKEKENEDQDDITLLSAFSVINREQAPEKPVALMSTLTPRSTLPAVHPVDDNDLRIDIDVDLPELLGDQSLASVELEAVRCSAGIAQHAANETAAAQPPPEAVRDASGADATASALATEAAAVDAVASELAATAAAAAEAAKVDSEEELWAGMMEGMGCDEVCIFALPRRVVWKRQRRAGDRSRQARRAERLGVLSGNVGSKSETHPVRGI